MPLIDSSQFYDKVEKSLNEQKFSPLYFIFGEEPYLVQQAYQYLKVCALHGCSLDFNFTQFFASDVEISRVRDEVETLPMMSTRRVVILREAQDLNDREWADIEPILSEPVESTVFILIGSKIDKRKKAIKTLLDQAVSIEMKKPYENQIPGWIRQIAKTLGLTLQDEAVPLLHRLVGNNLLEIESELKKLSSFLGQRTEILTEDVAQSVSKQREESVFAFAEAVAKADQVNALTSLANLIEQGQSEVGIVAMVARHIRILMLLKQGQDLGLSGVKLAAHGQVPPYFLADYSKQTRFWTAKKLEQVLLVLVDTDRALKSSPISAALWLENMVMKISNMQSELARSPVINIDL
jgi:DNA polymerase III subunit delta